MSYIEETICGGCWYKLNNCCNYPELCVKKAIAETELFGDFPTLTINNDSTN